MIFSNKSIIALMIFSMKAFPITASYSLAFNVNPSDGNNAGYYSDMWNVNTNVGSLSQALSHDYKSMSVWSQQFQCLAVARHDGAGIADGVKVWKLSSQDTLSNLFQSSDRAVVTSGGPVQEILENSVDYSTDPMLASSGVDNNLAFNWRYSNNGARVVLTDVGHWSGTLSGAGTNDDDSHGIGNDFGCNHSAQTSSNYWHDVAKIQGNCHGGSCTILGTDQGGALSRQETKYGNYAFLVAETDDGGNCPGITFSILESLSAAPSLMPSEVPSEQASSAPSVSSKPSSRPVMAIVNPCWNQNCNNAGKCEAISSKEFKCRCETTFINSANGRTCVCPPGFIRESDNRCYDPNTSVPISITSSPTASPNVSNTPGPTSSPSQTVAVEEDEGCNDDENARFYLIHDIDKHVQCSWLTSNKNRTGKRISNYCELPRVKTICKSTCSFCTCADDDAFTFELIKTEDPKRKTQHCDWLTRNKVNHELRIARYCTEDFEDGAVMNACTKSCGLCE